MAKRAAGRGGRKLRAKLTPLQKTRTRSPRKTSGASSRAGAATSGGPLLLKVRTPGYVPPGVDVRARVSPTLLTVTATRSVVRGLETDPEIVAISPSTKLEPLGRSPRR